MSANISKTHFYIRSLTEGAVLLALAVILDFLSGIIFASLPQGGSITLATFPLLFYVHRWGCSRGLLVCLTYGVIVMLLGKGYAWGWQSILLDYLLAYSALAIGGLFKGKDWGIFPAILLGCLGRFAVHHLSGITLYRIIEPTEVAGFGVYSNPHIYSLVYNGAYMIPTTVIALIIAGLLFATMRKYLSGKDLSR